MDPSGAGCLFSIAGMKREITGRLTDKKSPRILHQRRPSTMNLREQLKEILPRVLPKSPAESIKGTKLIEMVKRRLSQDYSDATLRYHFSVMSCDPTAPIAKVEQGQGYFLRTTRRELLRPRSRMRQESFDGFSADGESESPEQLWLKFQAFYERYANQDRSFSFPVRHGHAESSRSEDPSYPWAVPDAVVVSWRSGQLSESGVKLVPELLCLEEPSFTLNSTKMAVSVDSANYRQHFFQALSNGAWAHASELVVATEILDEYVFEDLRRLGNRFGVGVSFFALSEQQLAGWDTPDAIRELPEDEFDRALRDAVTLHRITSPRLTATVDWDHLNQLITKYPIFDDIFRWIHYCLMRKQACNFVDFESARYSP